MGGRNWAQGRAAGLLRQQSDTKLTPSNLPATDRPVPPQGPFSTETTRLSQMLTFLPKSHAPEGWPFHPTSVNTPQPSAPSHPQALLSKSRARIPATSFARLLQGSCPLRGPAVRAQLKAHPGPADQLGSDE